MTGLAMLLAAIVVLWALEPPGADIDWYDMPDDEEGP